MRTYRFSFYSLSKVEIGSRVELPQQECHHVSNVLRLKEGDGVELVHFETGDIFQGTIGYEGERIFVLLVSQIIEQNNKKFNINLILGLTKPKTIDFIVEKSVEIGISKIIIFKGNFSSISLNTNQIDKLKDRWRRIVSAAIKQSGSSEVLSVEFKDDLSSILDEIDIQNGGKHYLLTPPRWLSSVEKGSKISSLTEKLNIDTSIGNLSLQSASKLYDIYLMIGPEGGLSKQERDQVLLKGFSECYLVNNTLRTETAVIVAAGIASSFNF